jgi:hypothetical protein
MAQKPIKPGTPAPQSGLYWNPTTQTEATVVQGEPMPPTPHKGQGYVLKVPAIHKVPPGSGKKSR